MLCVEAPLMGNKTVDVVGGDDGGEPALMVGLGVESIFVRMSRSRGSSKLQVGLHGLN